MKLCKTVLEHTALTLSDIITFESSANSIKAGSQMARDPLIDRNSYSYSLGDSDLD